MNREVTFEFDWYSDLVTHLAAEGYEFASYADSATDGTAYLRHDVDWSPRKATTLGEIEAERDAQSTFFFLVTSPFYNVLNDRARSCISRVADLGHEIGLHFSTHQYWDENPGTRAVERMVQNELDVLETVTGEPVNTVSFHNPPEWVMNRSYEGFVSTYEPRFFEEIEYRADSDQRWRDEMPFPDGVPERVQILTHPVLWGERDGSTVDRLEEEREFLHESIDEYLNRSNRVWNASGGSDGSTE